jgi:hypothetical protein
MKIKSYLFLVAMICTFSSCAVQTGTGGYFQPVFIGPGIGLGTIIAVVISWTRNKSILLAIIHGILGWLYVIYALIVPKK